MLKTKEDVEFKGAVEEILPDGYRIAGRTVRVDGNTRIDDPITLGAWVEVKGVLQSDGSIRALRIQLEDRSGKDSGTREEGKKGDNDGKKGDDEKKDDGGKKDEDHHKDRSRKG